MPTLPSTPRESDKTNNIIMANETSLPVAVEKREVVYKAFHSEDEVRLNVSIIKNLVATPTKQGDLPGDRDCIRFMLLCRARRLDPFEGDAFLLGFRNNQTQQVDWSLITAHQAFLKRAETHPEFDGMESGVIVQVGSDLKELHGDLVPDEIDGDKCKLFGAWAKVHFKHRKIPMYKRAKLTTYQKNYGYWIKDPAGMITKCVEADCLRSSFPTMMGGMFLREEIDVSSQVTVEERRPDFTKGTPMPAVLPAVVSNVDKKPSKPVTAPAKTPQDAPKAPPAPPTSPAPETLQGEAAGENAPPSDAQPGETGEPGGEDQGEQQESTGTAPSDEQGEPTLAPEDDELPPFKPRPGESDALSSVRLMMHRNRIPELALMSWARQQKLAKEGQALSDLSSAKVENINANFSVILPKIRAIMAPKPAQE